MTTSTGAIPPGPLAPSAWRPLPQPDEETAPFWTGGIDGHLRIARCRACGTYLHPPGPLCPHCRGGDVAPEPVSGRGTVYSYTVNVHPWAPGLPVPYVIVVVQLDEQPDLRLTSNLVGCPPEEVAIGQRVEVRFEDHGEIQVPVFVPEGTP